MHMSKKKKRTCVLWDFRHGGHGECQPIDKTCSGSCPCACISRKYFLITAGFFNADIIQITKNDVMTSKGSLFGFSTSMLM